jgi:shikimate kinase
MRNLASNATIVYLDVPLAELRCRVKNYDERGIAARADQTFEDLFTERNSLYEQSAEVTINCLGFSAGELVHKIIVATSD